MASDILSSGGARMAEAILKGGELPKKEEYPDQDEADEEGDKDQNVELDTLKKVTTEKETGRYADNGSEEDDGLEKVEDTPEALKEFAKPKDTIDPEIKKEQLVEELD
jgi:hypothetical protein